VQDRRVNTFSRITSSIGVLLVRVLVLGLVLLVVVGEILELGLEAAAAAAAAAAPSSSIDGDEEEEITAILALLDTASKEPRRKLTTVFCEEVLMRSLDDARWRACIPQYPRYL
jgi:hypothetical protein